MVEMILKILMWPIQLFFMLDASMDEKEQEEENKKDEEEIIENYWTP